MTIWNNQKLSDNQCLSLQGVFALGIVLADKSTLEQTSKHLPELAAF